MIPRSTTLITGTSGSITVHEDRVDLVARQRCRRHGYSPPVATTSRRDANAQRSAFPPACARGARYARLQRPPRRMAPSVGIVSVARCTTSATIVLPARTQTIMIHRDALSGHRIVDCIAVEQLAGVAPQLVQRSLRPTMTLLCPVTQPHHPLTAVAQVILVFLQTLGGDGREPFVARSRECVAAAARCTHRTGTAARS